MIIDASTLFRKSRAQNFLDQEHSDRIVAWYRAFEDVEDRAKVATLDEIKKEGWTAEHLALRPAADRAGHPAPARSRSGLHDSIG